MALIIQNDAKDGRKYKPSAQITTARRLMCVIAHKLPRRVHYISNCARRILSISVRRLTGNKSIEHKTENNTKIIVSDILIKSDMQGKHKSTPHLQTKTAKSKERWSIPSGPKTLVFIQEPQKARAENIEKRRSRRPAAILSCSRGERRSLALSDDRFHARNSSKKRRKVHGEDGVALRVRTQVEEKLRRLIRNVSDSRLLFFHLFFFQSKK